MAHRFSPLELLAFDSVVEGHERRKLFWIVGLGSRINEIDNQFSSSNPRYPRYTSISEVYRGIMVMEFEGIFAMSMGPLRYSAI